MATHVKQKQRDGSTDTRTERTRRRNSMKGTEFILTRPALELFPHTLATAAQRFIDYLEALPYSRPSQCTWCGGHSFFLWAPAHTKGNIRDSFKCNACHRQFNILTDTPLRLLRKHDKWPEWMRLRFSGLAQDEIASLVGISGNSSRYWDRAFHLLMEEQEPTLHDWWSRHQSLTSTELSPHVAETLIACQQALHELCYAEERPCPTCGEPPQQIKRTKTRCHRFYFCTTCDTSFSNLTDTPFTHLQRIETWPEYLDLLVQGFDDRAMQRHFGFSSSRTGLWRQVFMQHLKEHWPLLAHWAFWMWARRQVTGVPRD